MIAGFHQTLTGEWLKESGQRAGEAVGAEAVNLKETQPHRGKAWQLCRRKIQETRNILQTTLETGDMSGNESASIATLRGEIHLMRHQDSTSTRTKARQRTTENDRELQGRQEQHKQHIAQGI